MSGDENDGAHVAHHVPVDAHQLGELAVSLVYLARSTPEACGYTHRRKHTIVIEQQALKGFLDKDQVLCGKRLARARKQFKWLY